MSDVQGEQSIEEIFEESWDGVLLTYHAPILLGKVRRLIVMDNFIHQFRLRGLDRSFRAGRIMDSLVLSRSQEHGLRSDQASIAFELQPNGNIIVYQKYLDDSEPFTIETPEITEEVDVLLQKLLSHPID